MDKNELHAQYLDLGYQPIPLKPASKLPLVKGWHRKPTVSQWYKAPQDVNIGLRAGDGRGFLDCDDKNQPGTFENVVSWLDGLGYHPGDYPVVQTASGVSRHIYVNFTGRLLGSKRNFVNQIGAGDFRYDAGAFVAAPPSTVDTGSYTLIDGDLYRLPELDLKDVATLINVTEEVKDDSPPVMSSKAQALSFGNSDLIEQYKSRSHAEQALIMSMVNSGFDFPAIKRIFDTRSCAGKYAEMKIENSTNAERWLYLSYQSALKRVGSDGPTRRKLAKLQAMTEQAAWKYPTDKFIMLAHLNMAYEAGRAAHNAGVRDLALFAGVHEGTVSRAHQRLIEAELLSVTKEHGGIYATEYLLHMDKLQHTLTDNALGVCCTMSTFKGGERSPQSESEPPEWKGERVSTHDAFRDGYYKDTQGKRHAKLGRRAGVIYELLLVHDEGLTKKEIATLTGVSPKTVQRTLNEKLAAVKDRKTGEKITLVSRVGNRWYGHIQDLDYVAVMYDTFAMREEQRERYEQERREHRKNLEKGCL